MPALTVLAGQQRIGLLVANDLLGARVEVQRSPDAHGQVAQVDQRGREVADFDLGIGAPPGLDRVQEVGRVAEQLRRVFGLGIDTLVTLVEDLRWVGVAEVVRLRGETAKTEVSRLRLRRSR